MEWVYEEFQHPLKNDLDASLAEVAASQLQRGLDLPSLIPDELKDRLDVMRQGMHELDLWYTFTRDWECTHYLRAHSPIAGVIRRPDRRSIAFEVQRSQREGYDR